MVTYLINHLRIPGVPQEENLAYLEQVEATAAPYGGKWLAIDAEVQVIEGAWRRQRQMRKLIPARYRSAWLTTTKAPS